LQLVPLSNLSQPSGSEAAPRIFGIRRNLGLAIAVGLLLAIILVAAVLISRHPFSARTASSYNTENQNPKSATSYPVSEVNKVAPSAAEPPASANSKQPDDESSSNAGSDKQADAGLVDAGAPVSPPSASSIKALPGVKPLPRLKSLPRLKPLPRLEEQRRSAALSPKSPRPNTSGNNNTKKESGVTSFLKKTGRILKKPFKF
jgi:hypothetical protein